MGQTGKTALVIVGHGSHLSPQTAAPAWQHADAIRQMEIFDEVTCAFWKEMPSLHRVLDTLTADDITIVPLFTSQGYFSQTVLPNELQLDGPVTQRDGRFIRYTETVGQHPHMTNVVMDRAASVMRDYQLDPTQTALAIAGHGTRRDPASAKATRQQVESIASTGKFAEVVAIYMDEPPEIESVYQITTAPSIIVVPFFVADGSHTQEDIPVDLGITSDPRRKPYSVPSVVNGRSVYYTSAVGMEPSVTRVILELAQVPNLPIKPSQSTLNAWDGFPQTGVAALAGMEYPFAFGQIIVDKMGDTFKVHPATLTEVTERIDTPAELRQRLSYDRHGNFRALRTGIDMPDGWYVEVAGYLRLLAVLETIYPTAWIDTVQQREGHLPIQSVEQVVARQTGMYKRVSKLNDDALPDLVMAHCGLCVRTPTWFNGDHSEDHIPCPEPCQCWMSFALQQAETKNEGAEALSLTTSDMESLQAALRSAITRPDPDVRPAEYDDPRNTVRLRVLLNRLGALSQHKND